MSALLIGFAPARTRISCLAFSFPQLYSGRAATYLPGRSPFSFIAFSRIGQCRTTLSPSASLFKCRRFSSETEKKPPLKIELGKPTPMDEAGILSLFPLMENAQIYNYLALRALNPHREYPTKYITITLLQLWQNTKEEHLPESKRIYKVLLKWFENPEHASLLQEYAKKSDSVAIRTLARKIADKHVDD